MTVSRINISTEYSQRPFGYTITTLFQRFHYDTFKSLPFSILQYVLFLQLLQPLLYLFYHFQHLPTTSPFIPIQKLFKYTIHLNSTSTSRDNNTSLEVLIDNNLWISSFPTSLIYPFPEYFYYSYIYISHFLFPLFRLLDDSFNHPIYYPILLHIPFYSCPPPYHTKKTFLLPFNYLPNFLIPPFTPLFFLL